ncbi:Nuclear aminoacylation-dependent tRNA export pathway component [Ceratocystis pirilliformis]|uniref:Nuclear aminoacylation-dependent tRNA export pathway component n=1 Tax=Ceratocystis pirilliformis TaxID=259994 RepID=A0ABR3Z1D9_9PEZI
MDFLKSAVASAMAMQGPPFPYSFGDRVDIDQSIWTLNNGTKKEDGSNCSIFSFDITANRSRLPLARNALKKMRTMRHPGVIKVLDTVETETYIYIATERVTPLRWSVKRKSLSPETIKWGLFTIASTLKFINEDAQSIHGNVSVSSIYASESGEWKLGGFDILSSIKDDDAIIYTYGSQVPGANKYAPPEVARGGWDSIKKNPHAAVDSFNFGTLIFEVFNGDYSGPDQAGQTRSIPPTMQTGYKRLVNPSPKSRLTVAHYLEQGKRPSSFFDSPLIKLTDGIDNLGMKSAEERDAFLNDLNELSDDFPEDFFKMKVLPELLKSVEFGGGGPKALSVVLKISTKLSEDEFNAKITPVIVRLFSNPDRALRVALLDGLPQMIDRLTQRIVNDKIFPHITSGFTDAAPIVREQTLKSVLTIITKLSDRTINGELLRLLAKTQNDEQPGIRTNTTICLGKIAKHLNNSSRSKVLLAAYSRSLRDPFVHARNAALMAFTATSEYFSDEECASRIIPAISPLLIDKEKIIRDQARRTMDSYLNHIRKVVANMPDSALPPPGSEPSGSTPRMGTPQPAASGDSAGSWAGWAISSFTNKLASATGEMTDANGGNSATGPKQNPQRALSPSQATHSQAQSQTHKTTTASSLHRQAVKSPILSSSRIPSRTASPTVEDDAGWNVDNDDNGADAWGSMDDIVSGTEDKNTTESNDSNDDIWGEPATESSPPPKKEAVLYDDGGEPDFAGWLAAQSKKPAAKPLPKGLSKSGPGRKPTGGVASRPKPASKPAMPKKIDTKPKDTGDDDGWGDGW